MSKYKTIEELKSKSEAMKRLSDLFEESIIMPPDEKVLEDIKSKKRSDEQFDSEVNEARKYLIRIGVDIDAFVERGLNEIKKYKNDTRSTNK